MPNPLTPPPGYGGIEPTKPPGTVPSSPNKEAFESYMKEPNSTEATSSSNISPMELAAKTSQIEPTPENILSQLDQTQNIANELKDKLATPNLNLKNSHQRLLDSKITQSFEHMQKAADYLGANKLDAPEVPKDTRPIAKFIGYLTSGQDQMMEAKKRLESIKVEKKTLSPSDMLLVQVNLAQAQQQIEFSSVLLSKLVDALKQTINIQL